MSFSTAKASISGSSVVPGLPNTIPTPSCLSRSRKARLPDITGTGVSKGLKLRLSERPLTSPRLRREVGDEVSRVRA